MRIAIQNPFAGKFAAETELSKRIYLAATHLGWQAAEVFSPDEIKSFAPDFVLSLHYHAGKLTEYPTYGCMWNPPQFFEGTEPFLQSILTYDGYLVSSEAIARRLRHLLSHTNKIVFTASFYTSCHHYPYHPPNLGEPKLAYLGVNWDGDRYQELFSRLDAQPFMEIYGSEQGWHYLEHSYRGNLPCDGVSVLRALNQAGVGLCLHKAEHRQSQTPSMRIFEIVASGAVAICADHAFIRQAFGDAVLYVDPDASPADLVASIAEWMNWIQQNPQAALDKSATAHQIFSQHFTLEKLLTDIVPYHQKLIQQKGFVKTSSPMEIIGDRASSTIQIIVPIQEQSQAQIQATFNSIARQTYGNLEAIAVLPETRHDCCESVQQSDEIPIKTIRYDSSPYGSTALWAGLNQVDKNYFAILEPGNIFHPNHCYTLISQLQKFPDQQVAYSGFIRVLNSGELAKFEGTKALTQLFSFSPFELDRLLLLEDYISANSLVAKQSVLDEIFRQDPELYSCQNLALVLYLAHRSSFCFSYEVTCEMAVETYNSQDVSWGQPLPHREFWDNDMISLRSIFWRQPFPNGQSLYGVYQRLREQQELERRLDRSQIELQRSHAELEMAQTRIQAMETSKFWQLRSAWFKVKRSLGLPVNE